MNQLDIALRIMFRVLSLFVLMITSATSKNASLTPIQQWPIIMAHDAGTTYLSNGIIINPWAKTQPSGGASGLLDCGARAFDWRPLLQNATDNSLVLHHGPLVVKHNMAAAIDEMVTWASQHKHGATDLIILGITDCACAGDTICLNPIGACTKAVDQVLANRNISVVTVQQLKTMTAQDATDYGQLPGGGAMIACYGCWLPHYSEAINNTCSGFRVSSDAQTNQEVEALTYTCYKDSSTKSFPFTRMWKYLDGVSLAGPPSDGRLYTAQALWQEDTESVIIGGLSGSSLLKDESKSGLNALLAERIAKGGWNVSRIGMVEINNVCDGGLGLKKVLDLLP